MMRRATVLGAIAVALVAMPAAAQVSLSPTTPRFAEVARIAQDGYADSARALAARMLAGISRNDAAYPEALYTAGVVARTGDSMRAVFSRVYTDFPDSPWADKALLRLVQIDFGFGKMDLAIDETSRLFADYDHSPVIPTAALWGARAAFTQQKMQQGCDWLTRGLALVGEDLELKNQLAFAKQSCNLGPDVVPAPRNPDSLRQGPPPRGSGDSLNPKTLPPAPPPGITKSGTKPPPAATASPWRVQVAAVRDKAVIQRLTQKLERAGFKTYIVPVGGGMMRVQAGPFATRAAAVAAVPKVKAAAGGSPIVVAAP